MRTILPSLVSLVCSSSSSFWVNPTIIRPVEPPCSAAKDRTYVSDLNLNSALGRSTTLNSRDHDGRRSGIDFPI